MVSLSLLAVSVAAGPGPLSFPLFQQCDPRWGNNPMGVDGPGERSTICGEGCAMTSVAMALNGLGLTDVTPGTLNAWLIAHQGYTCDAGDCNNLILDAPERLVIDRPGKEKLLLLVSEAEKPSEDILTQQLAAGSHIHVCHVRNNGHFVLATGTQIDPVTKDLQVLVNDPNHNVSYYPYENITDIIIYALKAVQPQVYPLYKQCNDSWANNTMTSLTICDVGCLMSSVSMALAGKQIPIPRADGSMVASDPATFNTWLQNNKGYYGDNDLEEAAVPALNPSRISWPTDGMHPTNDLSVATIVDYLNKGRVVIANVDKGGHFVLVVGYDVGTNMSVAFPSNKPRIRASTKRPSAIPTVLSQYPSAANDVFFYIHDPGFTRGIYSYTNDIVGWRDRKSVV